MMCVYMCERYNACAWNTFLHKVLVFCLTTSHGAKTTNWSMTCIPGSVSTSCWWEPGVGRKKQFLYINNTFVASHTVLTVDLRMHWSHHTDKHVPHNWLFQNWQTNDHSKQWQLVSPPVTTETLLLFPHQAQKKRECDEGCGSQPSTNVQQNSKKWISAAWFSTYHIREFHFSFKDSSLYCMGMHRNSMRWDMEWCFPKRI